jgi:hypothetical protein
MRNKVRYESRQNLGKIFGRLIKCRIIGLYSSDSCTKKMPGTGRKGLEENQLEVQGFVSRTIFLGGQAGPELHKLLFHRRDFGEL